MLELRPYQKDIDRRRRSSGELKRCIQSPTGSGKSELIRRAASEVSSLVAVVHREYLVDQIAELIPDAQIIKAGGHWDGKSKKIVGMIQTLRNRDLPNVDKVIVDECHHRPARSYDLGISDCEEGFTATPQRTDGQGLDAYYDTMICGPQYSELIRDGYLKPFKLYSIPSGFDDSQCSKVAGEYKRSDQNEAIRRSTIFGDVVEHWKRLCQGGGHISFWPSIEAAEHAASQVRGWEVLHSKLPKDEIRAKIKGLESGSITSLATIDIVGEGLNIRGIKSVSLCRLTASIVNYLQWCGRSNRGGSGTALIMDHGQNWKRHGLPDDDREWSLKGRIKKKREERGAFPVWDCPECWAVNRSEDNACVSCGLDKPREIRITEQVEARLELIERADKHDIHDLCSTPDEYRSFAKAKGKPPTWAAYQFAMRDLRIEADGDPFLEAAGQQRPTREQYMKAAWILGLSPKYAAVYAKQIRLTS